MSETYGEDARGHQIAGGFLIGAVSLVAAVAMILALYAWINPPGQVPPPPASDPITLADRYLAIAVPAGRQLATEENSFAANERDDLTAAKSDLMAEVATMQTFDKRLAAITFPAAVAAAVHALIMADHRRANLITRQARSASLSRLHSFDRRDRAANAAVAAEANLLRNALHAPPPSG
jgi:hypothetical protein